MAIDISMTEMANELHFGDGSRVVVLELFGMENSYGKVECARNVYRLGKNEEPVWQVRSDFDSEGNPFTNITYMSPVFQKEIVPASADNLFCNQSAASFFPLLRWEYIFTQ